MQSILKKCAFIGAVCFASASFAGEHGTAQECVALTKKAIASYKTNGREKTFDEITNSKKFTDKDLYLFAGPIKPGPALAHGANPKLVGKDGLIDMKDVDGKLFIREFGNVAESKEGKGWVDYKWPNPVTKAIENKSTYIERVDEIYFACGIYK